MLKSLSISNYALIENLEIDFPDGLIIITGETGAGKSILLGAISLLLGNRAEQEIFVDPDKNCVVEAHFTLSHKKKGNEDIIIRRVISPSGKSRSFVNDEPVNLQYLKELSEDIIDIHAQHEHLLLKDSKFRMSVLDTYADNRDLLTEYQDTYITLINKMSLLSKLQDQLIKYEEENDYNLFQLEQLTAAQLKLGELEELEEEFKTLSNAEEIKNSLSTIWSLIEGEDFSILRNLKEIQVTADRVASNYAPLAEISGRIESCRIDLKDIHNELNMLNDKIVLSPDRLQIVEERISLIYSLLNKHRLSKTEELIDLQEELKIKLNRSNSEKETIELLEKETTLLKERQQSIADKLHQKRADAAQSFSDEIVARARELEMPHASFEVKLERSQQYNNTGNSSASFLFSANKDVEAKELNKIGSGGELSRVMLCLKSISAKERGMQTMIFDEIDTGISGKVADKMGKLIYDMSKDMQIFAITHLPQIASKGDCHLLVYKDEQNGGGTQIKAIANNERVHEIARMLSGTTTTAAALANAEELLKK